MISTTALYLHTLSDKDETALDALAAVRRRGKTARTNDEPRRRRVLRRSRTARDGRP